MGFGVWGLGFGVWGLGFRGYRVIGLQGYGVYGLGLTGTALERSIGPSESLTKREFQAFTGLGLL